MSKLGIWVLSLFLLAGCVSPMPEALKQKEAKASLGVDGTIFILPIVDCGEASKEQKETVQQLLLEEIESDLLFKGYDVEVTSTFSENREILPLDISRMNTEDLSLLGPSGSNFIFIVFIDETSKIYTIFSKDFSMKAHAVLINKKSSEKIWENLCDVRFSNKQTFPFPFFGPLSRIIYTALSPMQEYGCKGCVQSILSTFPDNGSLYGLLGR